MNEQTINLQHTHILLLIQEKRLKEAFYQLEPYLWQCADWSLHNRFEQTQLAYNYMLQYMQQGIDDPERGRLHTKIQTDALEISDQARLLLLDRQSGYTYHTYRCQQRAGEPHSEMEQMRQELENFHDELAVSRLLSEQKQEAVLLQHEAVQKRLFMQTWTNSSWSQEESKEARAMLLSKLLPENDLCLFVSAVTLSLLACFDLSKLLWLIEAYQHSSTPVSQRSLVGMAFVFQHDADRLPLYPEIRNHLTAVAEVKPFGTELMLVQRQILLCQETEKIDKKMREEIIPEMIKKASSIRDTKLGVDESDEEKEEHNPDWSSLLDQPGIGDKLREMNELQIEGADVNMSTFSALKNFPFFQEIHNWFYPFDQNHSSVVKQNQEADEKSQFMDLILQSNMLCNNDRYSLFFIMQSIPQAQRQLMFGQLYEQTKELSEQAKEEAWKSYNSNATTISNQYLHDLYRFYKLSRQRMEFNDIFNEKSELYQIPTLKEWLYKPEFLLNLAHYHLGKSHWRASIELFQTVLEMNSFPHAADEFYQRIGYAWQKLGNHTEAISAYLKADTIQPDKGWTYRQLANCYRITGDFAEALTYYRKVETTDPENRQVVFHIAHCLTELQAYEEALNYFFKLDFLESNSLKAWRGIGWCSFVSGKWEQALNYYEKIINSQPLSIDFLNAGHVYWVSGNREQALSMYRQAARQSEKRDLFIELFRKDAPYLIAQGVAEEDIPLLLDLI